MTANASTKSGVDAAGNLGAASYDGSNRSNLSVTGPGGAGTTDGGIAAGEGVASNLKLDDPNLDKKKIDVPPVPADKNADSMDMNKMIMMMVLQIAIAGLLGPVMGGIGVGMTNALLGTSMQYNPNSVSNATKPYNCPPGVTATGC